MQDTSCSVTSDAVDGVAAFNNLVVNDAGITVPGSESHQRFVTVSDFPCEAQSTVIVLKLRGIVGNQVRDPQSGEKSVAVLDA